MRHLGMVKQLATLPSEAGGRLMGHIRALAGMYTAEKRLPQDARWSRKLGNGRRVDLRLCSIPTIHGESFSIRVLDRETQLRTLEQLGFVGLQQGIVTNMLHSPSGLVLVTGPTGAGKSTTLYAFLRYLNDGKRKIHTIEDPVEYTLAGLRQSQVDESNGADFYQLLRGVLRQGPDVIMIGEIRDLATAETAVRAANSGQLVFATLHAPVASAALQSMLGLGIPAHVLCTSLLGVIGQRLMRTVSPKTRVAMDMSHAPQMFDEVRQWLSTDEGRMIYAAASSEPHEGYDGRTGLFEIMSMTPAIRAALTQLQPASTIAQKAIEEGMMDFRRAALVKIAQGVTTFDEMCRVVPTGEMWVDV
jgi:type II secretory ATPase GspE/PulE/Tfp pilus assembly ATPase PilB-like protein